MDLIFYLIASLFFLKVMWNFLVPLLLICMEKSGSGQKQISMMPIEIIFLLLVVIYAFVVRDFYIFGFGALGIAFWGSSVMILSYVSCILFAWYKNKKVNDAV